MIAEGGDENGLKLDCGGACTILWIRWKSVSCTRDGWVPRHGNWTWVKCTLLTVQACPLPSGSPGPPHCQAPSFTQSQVGSPQPVPQDPKLLAPGGQAAEGPPEGRARPWPRLVARSASTHSYPGC